MDSDNDQTMRSGDEWQKFLSKLRILGIRDQDGKFGVERWAVDSTSGATYAVTKTMRVNRYDGGLEFLWHCDCPARKRCRHIDAVESMVANEAVANEDYDYLDILERTH